METTERGMMIECFQTVSWDGSNWLKAKIKMSPTIIAKAIPPIAPSSVFLGLIMDSLFCQKVYQKYSHQYRY